MLVEVVCMHCRRVVGIKEFFIKVPEGFKDESCCDPCLETHYPEAAKQILLARQLNKSKSQNLTFLDNDTKQEVINE